MVTELLGHFYHSKGLLSVSVFSFCCGYHRAAPIFQVQVAIWNLTSTFYVRINPCIESTIIIYVLSDIIVDFPLLLQ